MLAHPRRFNLPEDLPSADQAQLLLHRLIHNLQRDPVLLERIVALLDHHDQGAVAHVDGDDDCDVISLDDALLYDIAGGRGAWPLVLAMLAAGLGSGHTWPGLDRMGLAAAGGLVASHQSQGPQALQPGWQDHAIPLIQRFEGLALEAYVDPVGIATIGYGTIRYRDGKSVELGDRITVEQAEQLLIDAVHERYAPALLAAIPQVRHYSAAQQGALISFTYNVGVGALQRSSLRRRLLAGEDPQQVVAEELPRWSRGNGRELPGLVRRRAAEVELFQRGSRHG